jgi:MarR family transcriptional regulator, organic hydroperoxide resistance regulator
MARKEKSSQRVQLLRTSVLKRFRIIFGSVRQHFREVERISGVSGSQLWLLHEVSKTNGLGVSELADRLAIHQSTCSQLVEKLVRGGFLRKLRARGDQRRVELMLTAKGRRAVARAPGPAEGLLPEAIGELSAAELRRLAAGLDRIIQGLDQKNELAGEQPLSDL